MFAGKVPLLQRCKLPLVGVGKHLCGAATGESSCWLLWSEVCRPVRETFTHNPLKHQKKQQVDVRRGASVSDFRSGSTLFAGTSRIPRRDWTDPQMSHEPTHRSCSSWSGSGPGCGAVLPPSLRMASLRWSAVLCSARTRSRRVFSILSDVQLGHVWTQRKQTGRNRRARRTGSRRGDGFCEPVNVTHTGKFVDLFIDSAW